MIKMNGKKNKMNVINIKTTKRKNQKLIKKKKRAGIDIFFRKKNFDLLLKSNLNVVVVTYELCEWRKIKQQK